MKDQLVSFNERGEPRMIVDGATVPANAELLAKLHIDTAGDAEKAEEFVNELVEMGNMLDREAANKMVEGYREAARQLPPGRMLMVDSLGSVISHEQAAEIAAKGQWIKPAKTHKQRRAEKAAKKRAAKYKRSQIYRERGLL